MHGKKYFYPTLRILMCDREALEPAQRTMKTSIMRDLRGRMVCRPDLFPPDGKGIWRIEKGGKGAQQLVESLEPL